jgi:hypothetical protein
MDGPNQGDVSADGESVWDTDHWEPLRLTADQIVHAVDKGWGLQANSPPRYLAEGLMNHSWHLSTVAGGLRRTGCPARYWCRPIA